MKNWKEILLLLIISTTATLGFDDMDYSRKAACLTGDAVITLANGTQRTIKDIKTGDQVINQMGQTVSVLKVVAGPEKKPVYKITFESGKEITATEKHPFIDNNGTFLISQDLSSGQELKGEDGIETVKSISIFKYDGFVYNLVLASEELFTEADKSAQMILNNKTYDWRATLRKQNPFLGLTDSAHSYYANGIASGDLVIQVGLLK